MEGFGPAPDSSDPVWEKWAAIVFMVIGILLLLGLLTGDLDCSKMPEVPDAAL